MRINFILIGACTVMIVACSSKQKNSPAAPKQTASTPSANSQTLPDKAKAESTKDEITCSRNQESRTLRIENPQPKGCLLYYSNHSSTDPVASSSLAKVHCENVRDKIQQKLEEAGFQCSAKKAPNSTTPLPENTKTETQKKEK
ncbi:MAG: hypothetical protein AB7N80_07000 [Bdellovibrionales bacterium]